MIKPYKVKKRNALMQLVEQFENITEEIERKINYLENVTAGLS